MTPARPLFRSLPVIAAMAVLGIATWAFSQLQTPDARHAGGEPAPVEGAASTAGPPSVERSGSPQAEPAATVDAAAAQVANPEPVAAATTDSGSGEPAAESSSGEPAQASAPATATSAEISAFIAALAAAERANENLAARLAQMEASAALQRERDQAFIRDMIKGVLWLAGAMASIGMLALVAIVYLQVRSTKQQAITFAAQLQALTSHIALPGPSGTALATANPSRNQFDTTAQKIEQRLSDLESMTSGLPESHAHTPAPAGGGAPAASVEFTVPRGERTADLLAKADSLLVQQQPEIALAYIDQAIGNEPRNAEAHFKRGAALERLDRLTEAITAYDRTIEAEPTLSVAFLAKAGVLNKLQRYAEALKCYEAALALQGGGQSANESPAA